MTQIIITRMQIGNFEVNVPHGLSELLNSAGAWAIKKSDSTITDQYDRRVEKRDGQLVTILTRKF